VCAAVPGIRTSVDLPQIIGTLGETVTGTGPDRAGR
jgi:hypothetical protein